MGREWTAIGVKRACYESAVINRPKTAVLSLCPSAGLPIFGFTPYCSARQIVASPQSYSTASSDIVSPAAYLSAILRLWPVSNTAVLTGFPWPLLCR